ncbi:hypothetical protein WMY93_033035, partial [Mugilogobius chulae]
MAWIGDADPFTAAIPATKVELSVSCRNLLDRDTFSKSDPICVLYTQGIANREWREFGRTEVIDNTLNPDFVRKFILDYFFEDDRTFASTFSLSFLTLFLSFLVVCLQESLSLSLSFLTLFLSFLVVYLQESVMLQFCGNKLDKKDFFGKSDPFLVFFRSNEDGSFTICHKTEVVKNTLDPVWQAFKIPVRALCNGDYDRSIKVEVYDWDRDGGHDFIGEFSTSYREMCRSQSQFHVYEVLNPKKKGKKKKKYQNSGTVTLLSCLVDSELSFLDYIRGGTQINFTVAIDFTASNGHNIRLTYSLHLQRSVRLRLRTLTPPTVSTVVNVLFTPSNGPVRLAQLTNQVNVNVLFYASNGQYGSLVTSGLTYSYAPTGNIVYYCTVIFYGPVKFKARVAPGGGRMHSSRGPWAARHLVSHTCLQ